MQKDLKAALAEGRAVGIPSLAYALNVSPVTLHKAVDRGEIQVTRIGKRKVVTAPVARRLLGMEAG